MRSIQIPRMVYSFLAILKHKRGLRRVSEIIKELIVYGEEELKNEPNFKLDILYKSAKEVNKGIYKPLVTMHVDNSVYSKLCELRDSIKEILKNYNKRQTIQLGLAVLFTMLYMGYKDKISKLNYVDSKVEELLKTEDNASKDDDIDIDDIIGW